MCLQWISPLELSTPHELYPGPPRRLSLSHREAATASTPMCLLGALTYGAPSVSSPSVARRCRYVPQYKAHSQILVTFQELTAALVAVTLPQQLQIGG